MLEEAKKHQSDIDTFFLRHFKILPEGVTDLHDLLPVQKEYLMWLTIASPSLETWSIWMQYNEELQLIKEKDYTDKIETPDSINAIVAKQKGLSLDQYKIEIAKKFREDDIKELNEKYGIKSDTKEKVDMRKEILNRYDDLAKKLEEGDDKIKQLKAASKLFERPKEEKGK